MQPPSLLRDKIYTCDVCDRTFTLKQNIAYHFYVYHHPRLPDYNRRAHEVPVSQYQCRCCDLTFTDRELADIHEKSHVAFGQQKPAFQCNHCEKTFNSNATLLEHVQIVHEKLRPHVCNVCGQTFGRLGGMRRHQQMVHENKMYMCPYEGCTHPGYKCSKALAAHIRSLHTFERPFICQDCGRSFVRKNDLRVHKMTHSESCEHVCEDCGAGFKRDTYLRKHIQHCLGVPITMKRSYK